MKPLCDNPNCGVCRFARVHPDEQRMSAIRDTARCLAAMCQCMAKAELHMKPMLELASMFEQEVDMALASRIYSTVIDANWTQEVAELAKPLQLMFQFALRFMPSDVRALATEMYEQEIRAAGEEQACDEDTILANIAKTKQYLADLDQVTDKYFAGEKDKVDFFENFPAPTSLQ